MTETMTADRPPATHGIDTRIGAVLDDAEDYGLPLVAEALPEDRWYGQLLIATYDAVTDADAADAPADAAAAIELLRGYCRLRCALLAEPTDDTSHQFTREGTARLLAGDFLYSAAYSSLRGSTHASRDACFAVLTDTLDTITGTFAATYAMDEPDRNPSAFVDDTAGELGASAARIGATLAGRDGPLVEDLARFGRHAATVYQIATLADSTAMQVAPPSRDEATLQTHADRRWDDLSVRLDALSDVADSTALRALLDAIPGGETTPLDRP